MLQELRSGSRLLCGNSVCFKVIPVASVRRSLFSRISTRSEGKVTRIDYNCGDLPLRSAEKGLPLQVVFQLGNAVSQLTSSGQLMHEEDMASVLFSTSLREGETSAEKLIQRQPKTLKGKLGPELFEDEDEVEHENQNHDSGYPFVEPSSELPGLEKPKLKYEMAVSVTGNKLDGSLKVLFERDWLKGHDLMIVVSASGTLVDLPWLCRKGLSRMISSALNNTEENMCSKSIAKCIEFIERRPTNHVNLGTGLKVGLHFHAVFVQELVLSLTYRPVLAMFSKSCQQLTKLKRSIDVPSAMVNWMCEKCSTCEDASHGDVRAWPEAFIEARRWPCQKDGQGD